LRAALRINCGMIFSASYRTDIPAFHSDWFNRRLDAGYCTVKNPYSGKVGRVSLEESAVDGFVFWTRRLGPFSATLERLAIRGTPFLIQFTVTGYPRSLESAVMNWRRAVGEIQDAASRFGPRVVVWRYDPVFISNQTPAAFHVDRMGQLAEMLAGATDEVVLSFAHIYRKSRRNIESAALRHGFTWSDPANDAKRSLLRALADIAGERGIRATLCSQPDLLTPGLSPARCIDAARLSDVAGRPIKAPEKGNRPGCACAESRDIGAYDTCPHGCVYCYAVSSRRIAKRRIGALNPAAEGLHSAGEDEPA
jgi:hypothetical protein